MAKQSTPTARLFDQLLYVLSLGFIDDETYDGMDDDELELYLQQSDDDYSQDAIDVDVDVEDVSSASGSSNAVGSTHHADSAEVKATPEQSDVDGSSSSGGGDSNRISYGERVNLSQHIEGKRKKFVFTPPLVI